MIEKFPYRIQKILNDRGQEFQAHFTSTLRRRVSDISISNRTLRDNTLRCTEVYVKII